jgi:hypothetical protein
MTQVSAETRVRRLKDLPSPKGLPLLGNALQLDPSRLHLILEKWCEQLGESYTFGLGPKRIFVSSNPEHLQTALRERPERYRRDSPIEEIIAEMGFNGVAEAEQLIVVVIMVGRHVVDGGLQAADHGRLDFFSLLEPLQQAQDVVQPLQCVLIRLCRAAERHHFLCIGIARALALLGRKLPKGLDKIVNSIGSHSAKQDVPRARYVFVARKSAVFADQFAEYSQRWRDRVRQRAFGVLSLTLEIFEV